MAIMKKRTHETITEPLKKMVDDLNSYVEEQENTITKLEEQKEKINKNIDESSKEIKKSNNTAKKIADLIGDDEAEVEAS